MRVVCRLMQIDCNSGHHHNREIDEYVTCTEICARLQNRKVSFQDFGNQPHKTKEANINNASRIDSKYVRFQS